MKSLIWNKIAVLICAIVMIISVFKNHIVRTVALGFLATINTMIILNDK